MGTFCCWTLQIQIALTAAAILARANRRARPIHKLAIERAASPIGRIFWNSNRRIAVAIVARPAAAGLRLLPLALVAPAHGPPCRGDGRSEAEQGADNS